MKINGIHHGAIFWRYLQRNRVSRAFALSGLTQSRFRSQGSPRNPVSRYVAIFAEKFTRSFREGRGREEGTVGNRIGERDRVVRG